MKFRSRITVFIIFFFSVFASNFAQNGNENLNRLFDYKGLEAKFLFYREGNGISDNGVVLLLKNQNDFDIDYKFDLVFNGTKFTSEKSVQGKLSAGEIKTGSNSGLFFLPFRDSTNVLYEIGVKKIRITKYE